MPTESRQGQRAEIDRLRDSERMALGEASVLAREVERLRAALKWQAENVGAHHELRRKMAREALADGQSEQK